LAVAGKGGSGKSVVAGTLARLAARRGRRVLALDSDLMPGLALSLGAPQQRDAAMLVDAVERDETGRWRLKKGIGPARAVARYSVEAPDGVRLLQAGKVGSAGLAPILGSINGFYAVVHRLRAAATFERWAIVGDLPAGPRQLALDWAPYADLLLVVAEPSPQSLATARRIAGIARARGRPVLPVANKVREAHDAELIERALGTPLAAAVPVDASVAEAEREGLALLDYAPDAPAARALDRLVEKLEREYASER
jgi:CO dehydrogenase maturation factor